MLKTKKYPDIYLSFAINFLLAYIVLKPVLGLSGVSVGKILLTSLSYLVLICALIASVKRKTLFTKQVPASIITGFYLLLLWNLFTILKSAFADGISFTTLFGNEVTTLPLLLPLALIFGLSEISLYTLLKKIVFNVKAALYFLPVAIGFNSFASLIPPFYFASMAWFLLPSYKIHKVKIKKTIIFSIILTLILGFFLSNRTSVIRLVLLLITTIPLFFYRKIKLKIILYIPIILLFVISYFFIDSIINNESIFSVFLENIEDDELSTDTRSFLYSEVLLDLKNNNAILTGKGAASTYYSDYFSLADGDSENRLTAEVGFLALLLKGGVVAVLLNIYLFLSAVRLALLKSNNLFIKGVGMFLIVHLILFFLENLIIFDIYNFLLWFFVGLCASKKIRNYNDNELQNIIFNKI